MPTAFEDHPPLLAAWYVWVAWLHLVLTSAELTTLSVQSALSLSSMRLSVGKKNNQPTSQTANQSVNLTTKQPSNQATHQIINQPVSQPVYLPTSQSTHLPTNLPINKPNY